MRPWLTGAAILATLILAQLPGNAAAAQGGPVHPVRALAVIERLVHHRAPGAASAFLHLAAPSMPLVQAQYPRFGQRPAPYCVQEFYDRVTESSRGVATLSSRSRRFGLGSRVSADVSYTYRGRQLTTPPAAVTITLESFTPARGGWAFARPRPLEIRSPGALMLEVSPKEYRKHPVHLFDAGRRELLSFRIDTAALARLVAEPELSIKAGSAVVRLRGRRMALLGQVLERIRSGSTEGVGRCR